MDRDYGDGVYGLAFAPDGGLITSSFDGLLRRYGPDRKMTVKDRAPDGKTPFGVTIDPSGRHVAVGYNDGTPVSILDARTLKPVAKAQTSDLTKGDLAVVAWSRDGATLVAGGRALADVNGEWRTFVRRFDATGRRQGADMTVSNKTITDGQPCGDGFVFGAADPSFRLLSPQGVVSILQGPRTADMGGKVGMAFAVSPDASSVRFGLGRGRQNPVVFDLAAASIKDSPSPPSGFAPAKVDGLPVTDWPDNFAPKFNGAKLALEEEEKSRALAVRADASGFALATEFLVRAYDAKGKERWSRAGPGIAWGVDFSADGEILAVAYDDGTIRWLRWKDGGEKTAENYSPCSSSRNRASGSPGRRAATTWPPPAART